MTLPASSSITPGISLVPRCRGPIPDRNKRSPTRFACGNAPTGSGARSLSKDLLIDWLVLSLPLPRSVFLELWQLRIHVIPGLSVGSKDIELRTKQGRVVQA